MPTPPRPRPLSFRPSARLQKYLGQELIADPNLAIIEFVKNAYDAGATHAIIDFTLESEPSRLLIADNGSGMTQDEFRENWMRPGFSHKAQNAPPRRAPEGPGARSRARQLERARIPAGEKGLGRMAAGRLGERLDVYTRPSAEVPWLHVPFVWSEFDDMTKAMDQVEVTPDYDSTPPDNAYDSGTVIVISGLRQKWDGRVRGRPVPGRARTKLGRLRQDLEHFVRPLHPDSGEFSIDLDSDRATERNDLGHVTVRTAAEAADYEYQFRFARSALGGAEVTRAVRRSEAIARTAGKPNSESLGTTPVSMEDAEGVAGAAPLACGGFAGTFFYSPPPASARATKVLPMGVLLYRDGVWVEPYGIDDDDWLGVAARKAQRQGHAAIQPNTMTGHVDITREGNPNLEDMSNRMGLLETDESEEFLYLVREEFRFFEQMVYEEVLEKRWEGNRAKEAGRKASGEVGAAAIFMRSLAHSVRQPLEGLQVEIGVVRALAERAEMPDSSREILRGVASRAGRHADSAGVLIQEALRFEVPEFSEANLQEMLQEVRRESEPLAESLGVVMEFEVAGPRATVIVPRRLVEQAISAVVANALQAPRARGVHPRVRVEVTRIRGDWGVAIVDNGTGIPSYEPGQSLASVRRKHGRPGVGLRVAELAAHASQGRLTVEATGDGGTRMLFVLPERAAGLHV